MSDARPQITPIKDGPLRIQGLKRIDTADGAIECESNIALCRCGRSENKPFCDGTHVRVGFSSDKIGGPNPDRRDDYAGKTITIHDNRAICSHAGFCTDGLPSVFRMSTEPWIDPDGATAEKIIETVRKCPSGALSYSIDGVEHRSDPDRPPSVSLAPGGPMPSRVAAASRMRSGVPRHRRSITLSAAAAPRKTSHFATARTGRPGRTVRTRSRPPPWRRAPGRRR